jgi:hypothetical protein
VFLRPNIVGRYVYNQLTSGAGILEAYTEWIMYREPIIASVDWEATSEGPNTAHVDSMPVQGRSSGMQHMLNDVFAMHNVQVKEGGSQVGVDAEAVDAEMEDSNEGARKLYDLSQDADTPLHENTKYSKLGAIVRLYSLKCMGGWSNSSFSMLFEFINELIPLSTPLLKDKYEAKKYMRDLGLGSKKISACRDGCMLF